MLVPLITYAYWNSTLSRQNILQPAEFSEYTEFLKNICGGVGREADTV